MTLDSIEDILHETTTFLELRHSELTDELQEIQTKIDEVEEAQNMVNTLDNTYQNLLEMIDVMKGD
jgi:prefoldin subunit 5